MYTTMAMGEAGGGVGMGMGQHPFAGARQLREPGFPVGKSAVTPSDIYSPQQQQSMANLASAQPVQNLSWLQSKAGNRPGMSRLGGIGALAAAPFAKSMFDAASNRQASMFQTSQANAAHRLAGEQGRLGGALGFLNPQLNMYGTDIQNRGADLSNLNALSRMLFGGVQ
jgi:hypothetical protein